MESKQIKKKKGFKIDCCWVAIALCFVIIICFGMFFNYSAKLSKDEIEITKLSHRTQELEEKNGSEQKQIDDLKQEIKRLEEVIRRRGGN